MANKIAEKDWLIEADFDDWTYRATSVIQHFCISRATKDYAIGMSIDMGIVDSLKTVKNDIRAATSSSIEMASAFERLLLLSEHIVYVKRRGNLFNVRVTTQSMPGNTPYSTIRNFSSVSTTLSQLTLFTYNEAQPEDGWLFPWDTEDAELAVPSIPLAKGHSRNSTDLTLEGPYPCTAITYRIHGEDKVPVPIVGTRVLQSVLTNLGRYYTKITPTEEDWDIAKGYSSKLLLSMEKMGIVELTDNVRSMLRLLAKDIGTL